MTVAEIHNSDTTGRCGKSPFSKNIVLQHGLGDYGVDHLIPLELGGSNSIKNLWPEFHRTSPWNAQVKDRLEGKLHELVCARQLDLKTAQQAIASNWIEAYKMYVSPNRPVSRLASESGSRLR